MRINPESIARSAARRPWLTIGTWLALLAVGAALTAAFLSGNLTTEFDFTDVPESAAAERLLEERLQGPAHLSEVIVLSSESENALDGYVADLQSAVGNLGGDVVAEITTTGPTGDSIVSADGRHRLLSVELAATDLDGAAAAAAALGEAVEGVVAPSGVEARLFGTGTLNNDFERLGQEGAKKGETIGVAAAIVVLLVVIGSAVAAGLPVLLAIAAIVTALGLAALVGNFMSLSFTVVSFITMMGLAVGIDYALFIVARYREERRRGSDVTEAIGRAGATANRTVLFSGLTVTLALLGLLLVPNTVFRSLGVGAILVVLIAVAASMTLLPAILALLGDRIDKGRVRRRASLDNADEGGIWERISAVVMRRPVAWLVTAGGLLLVLAAFSVRLETGFTGLSSLPDDIESKQAFEVLHREFGLGGVTDPVEIVIDGRITPEVESAVDELSASLAEDARFGRPAPFTVNQAGDLGLLSVPITGDAQSAASHAAVESMRQDLIPTVFAGTDARILVGGASAFEVDFLEDVQTFTPIVFVFVLGLSFLLLTIAFRSIVLPIKAILLNLLSVGATYGALVLVFQTGTGPAWLKEALPFIQVDAIEAWVPLFLFAVLFGLSMDYHVFLLTRIREHYDQTGDNPLSVAHGLRTTGAIITGAALIMVAVFIGFALGELSSLQQLGFGLGVAVLLDATIVRSILVPATMRLLGSYNWYLPRWLTWLPRIDVEGSEAAPGIETRAPGPGVLDPCPSRPLAVAASSEADRTL